MDQASAHITLRRLRQTPALRNLVAQIHLHRDHFVQPVFVAEGLKSPVPLRNIHPDLQKHSSDSLLFHVESLLDCGCKTLLLFGVPAVKRETGFLAEFTASQLTAIKKRFGSAVTLAVDVCLCSHTLSGACGYLDSVHGIQNEKTVQTLLEFSLAYATAGADILAPSDMMDGRVAAIRQMLNAHGFHQTSILSYSAKFHSRFYGPFREAAESAPKGSWDRADHQIDPRNGEDAIRCTLRDVEEGADMVMVKPGLPYLDIVYRLTQEIAVPCAVYQVSGESAALEAIANGDENCRKHLYLETWTAFHRAGARFVISYAAKEGQRWLRET